MRNATRLASLTLIGAAGIYVEDVPQVDTFLNTEEQRIRDLFYDQELAEAVVASSERPEMRGRRAQESDHDRQAGVAAAQLRSASAQVAAPHQACRRC